MKNKRISHGCHWVLGAALMMGAASAWAHKINLFVNVEGDRAEVMGYFADGKVPKQTPVTVFDSQGVLIVEGQTNDDGEFNFKLPNNGASEGLKVKIDAGMGHKAEYIIPKEDLYYSEESLGAASSMTETVDSPASNPVSVQRVGDRHLTLMIEKAVAKANRPVLRSLDAMRKKASLSDIIGGIGLIFGALGLWFFLQAKKLQPKRPESKKQ